MLVVLKLQFCVWFGSILTENSAIMCLSLTCTQLPDKPDNLYLTTVSTYLDNFNVHEYGDSQLQIFSSGSIKQQEGSFFISFWLHFELR